MDTYFSLLFNFDSGSSRLSNRRNLRMMTLMSALRKLQKNETCGKAGIHWEPVPLHDTRAAHIYQQVTAAHKVHHINVAEEEIQFCKKVPRWTDVMSPINFQGHGDVQTSQPWWISETNQVSHLQPEEKVKFRASESEKGKKSLLVRPEHKRISMMDGFVTKFSKAGELLMDIFSGTFAAEKPCLKFP